MFRRYACLSVLLALACTSNAFVVPNNNVRLANKPAILDQQHATQAKSQAQTRYSHSSTRTALLSLPDPLLLSEQQQQQQLSFTNVNVWIFVAGLIPFAWATIEFWRRIAVGEPFGTGSDSVFIGKDFAPQESRGRRVLDKGAFAAAYVLFGIAALTLGITLYAVLTSSPNDMSTLPPPQ